MSKKTGEFLVAFYRELQEFEGTEANRFESPVRRALRPNRDFHGTRRLRSVENVKNCLSHVVRLDHLAAI